MDDVTDTLAPKSDQLDSIDLATGPRVFTVEKVDVKKGAEQPVVIHLVEFDRPWKPGVTMRRVLAGCWGTKSAEWVGKRVELYRDPEVVYGKDKPGGTRIARLSGIEARTEVDVMLTRGRMGKYTVEPLTDATTGPTAADVAACTNVATLRSWWQAAPQVVRASIEARVTELSAASEGSPQDDAPGYDEVPPSDDDLFGSSDG